MKTPFHQGTKKPSNCTLLMIDYAVNHVTTLWEWQMWMDLWFNNKLVELSRKFGWF